MTKSNTKSVSTTFNEHLSSVIDGEAGDFEQRRVFDELSANDGLLNKISSYSLIGEIMRSGSKQSFPIADSRFLTGIHERIDSGATSTTSLNEYLSAVLDDEAESFEQTKVLDELRNGEELRQKVSSYSLIGETMRAGSASVVIADSSFLTGVHDKILSEEEYSNITLIKKPEAATPEIKANTNNWLKPIGGFAMAASLAAVVFIGFQSYQSTDDATLVTTALDNGAASSKTILVANNAELSTPNPAHQEQIISDDIASIATSYRHADNKTRMLLKKYVDRHMKHASLSAFVPSVRTIAYTD